MRLKRLEQEVSRWPNTSVHPHRYGGREFRFGSAEVGHIHNGGVVDIPFPRPVRDALLADGLAELNARIRDHALMFANKDVDARDYKYYHASAITTL